MSGIPVFSAGTSLQSSGASVSAQIPADSAGMLPLFVRVTATAAGYFRLSQDGAPAAVGDLLIQPSDGLILKTCGLSQFSFVSQSGASTVTVTPIDVGGIKYPTNIFTPAALFTTGVNGAWYDPSDFGTMFQDAAGTTPVTAVGQPVGRILDKSGRGNHAFNPNGNSADFPVLSARYNLLTKTEDISAADWTKGGATAASTSSLLETATTGTHSCTLLPTTVAATYIYSVKLKANGRTRFAIAGTSSFGGNLGSGVFFDLSTGSYVSGATGTPSITALADGWYQVSYTWVAFAASGVLGIYLVDSGTNISYAGDVTKGVLIKEADLRVSNDALNQPQYQRVNTATDYDTVGFKPYLSFNGVNQWLQTNSIDFTYGDKMFVSAGVRKLSDAALQFPVELSTSVNGQNGSFAFVSAAPSVPYKYAFASRGTITVDPNTNNAAYSAPVTNVLSGIGDISSPSATLRINGTQAAKSTASQGTGNYGNYPLYIGARAGVSLWFNGRLYGLVVAGKQASASEIASTEAWLNQKTGAY